MGKESEGERERVSAFAQEHAHGCVQARECVLAIWARGSKAQLFETAAHPLK